MNPEERDWLDWLKRVWDGVMTQRRAAEKMGITHRWVRTLLARMGKEGDEVVVHGLRGHPSNRRIDEVTQTKAVKLLKQPECHDFGPTFASEQLAKRHKIHVSKETTRGWMIEAGIWKSHPRKLKEVHVWRPRRSCYAVYMAGSSPQGRPGVRLPCSRRAVQRHGEGGFHGGILPWPGRAEPAVEGRGTVRRRTRGTQRTGRPNGTAIARCLPGNSRRSPFRSGGRESGD